MLAFYVKQFRREYVIHSFPVTKLLNKQFERTNIKYSEFKDTLALYIKLCRFIQYITKLGR